jgi:glucosamine-6-phosphate deaminase
MSDIAIVNKLRVRRFPSRDALGQAAAAAVAETIIALLKEKETVNIIFAAAPSQNEMLDALVKKEGIDWARVNAFHMDEYIGLPAFAEQTFGTYLKNRIFSLLPFHHVYYLNGAADNLEAELKRYEDLLQHYPTDIVCMGIGENGHLAFNDPPVADFNDPALVKRVELEDRCRQQQVNDGCFTTLEEVPVYALTLTIPALLKAAYVCCCVPGVKKAQAVYDTLHEEMNERFPSTILRTHPNATLYIDEQSGQLLDK